MSGLNHAGRGAGVMDAVAPLVEPPVAVPRRLLRLRSDAVLAERFAAGDEAAFAVLYERHRASVLAVCMGVLGSKHDAEDAAQDAFAALAVTLSGHPPRELRAWLARVARNAAIDVARRRRRTVNTDGEVPDVPAASSGAKAELEHVMAGIRELPESQRTALLMRELAGHSYAEIAALLETDEEAVRGLIARARMGLRTHREASELSCASARAALAAEPNGSTHDKTVRRHVRGCAPCRAYKQALRSDARALRGILPAAPAGGVAGGGAIFGGLAAKGALVGGAVSQMTAACAVSACAVGGVVLLDPSPHPHRPARARTGHSQARSSLPDTGHRTFASAAGGSAGAAARTGSGTGTHPAASGWTATISGTGPGHGSNSQNGLPGVPASSGYTDSTRSTRPAGPTGSAGSAPARGPSGYVGPASGSAPGSPTGPMAAGRQAGPGSAPRGSPGYQPQRAPGGGDGPGHQLSMNRPGSRPIAAISPGGIVLGRPALIGGRT